jgi:alkanesulfonate monooxygenase SsuD/methylene tetrahydromethanopterin reductase-like flavin-dependent oxidoreductase (luciferase family)
MPDSLRRDPVIGAIARPQLPPERIAAVARAAEAAGLDELWLWEDCFWEGGVSMAGAVLGMTQRLKVGVGLLPMPLRNVALAAMEIAALDRLFPGRFVVALGHGVQDWMRQAGAQVASPLTLATEYFAALRGLLAGEVVTTSGKYVRLDQVQLVWPPATPTALHMGATGPKSLRLSGAIADGTILSGETELPDFARSRELVQEAWAAAGRAGAPVISGFVPADLGAAGAAEQLAAWAAAGADRIVFCPGDDEPDPEGFVATIAALARG